MSELAGDLEERRFQRFRIGAYLAAAYRSLHVRQFDMEVLSELVTQAVRRNAEFLFVTPAFRIVEAVVRNNSRRGCSRVRRLQTRAESGMMNTCCSWRERSSE